MMEDMLPHDHSLRMQRALLALEGLSLGDAFGECFFDSSVVLAALDATRALPAAPWNYTDDTEMALAIVEVLGVPARGIGDKLSDADVLICCRVKHGAVRGRRRPRAEA